jgi:hypothetical protein
MMANRQSAQNPNFVLFGGDNLVGTQTPMINANPNLIQDSISLGSNIAPQRSQNLNTSQTIQELKSPNKPHQNFNLANQLSSPTSIPIPYIINNQIVNYNPNSGIPLPGIAQSLANPPITFKNLNPNENAQTFNMHLSYKNQIPQPVQEIHNLFMIEKKLENIDKLSNNELNDGIIFY